MTEKMTKHPHHPASYRDPAGYVFQAGGVYYRQVSQRGAADYDWLMSSGLYRVLTEKGLLLSHAEIQEGLNGSAGSGPEEGYKTLRPVQLNFISYPYEWSFDQLRDAALLTLKILSLAIDHGMTLKDATPFNIQFHEGRPVFIDTLSFEKHIVQEPWVAYRQFCECCLYPLYLEHYTGISSQKWLTAWPDGIPAAATASLLPWRSRLNMGVWMHVRLQNMVKPAADKGKGYQAEGVEGTRKPPSFNLQKLRHLIQHLEQIVAGLRPRETVKAGWSNYYGKTILGQGYLDEKEKVFRELIQGLSFNSALDLGANEGYFSLIAAEQNSREKKAMVLSVDADPYCINALYRVIREKELPNIQPLCIDLAQPSAAIGFRNAERAAFNDRARADLVLALALIHHLALGYNIPLNDIAPYLAELTTGWLLAEFVPLKDEKAQELVRNKRQYHRPYDQAAFENAFLEYFSVEKKERIPGTERILYLMKKIRPA